MNDSNKLTRYTTLPVLLDLLKRKTIVLTNPEIYWEDQNDVKIITEYKRQKRVKSLYAVCFGLDDETVHDWKAFADGGSGCCIQLDKDELLKSFHGIPGVRRGEVKYQRTREVEESSVPLDRRPFTKRWPYRCECEFRILWEGDADQKETKDVRIDLDSIRKITLSQRLPVGVTASIKDLLRDTIGDPDAKINISTLYENKRWIKALTSRC
jgi:hypothetical protein